MPRLPKDPEELVRQIHAASGKIVLVLNGGSRALAELLEVPGGSRILLEAAVPYSAPALTAWLGSRPEQFCSSRAARAMAVVAFGRAMGYGAAESQAAGVSCTAGLATDRPKRGPHRAHVAVQTANQTQHWSLELEKEARGRQKEEQVVSGMVLNALAEACGVAQRLELPLLEHERVEIQQVTAPRPWQDLFLGRVEAIRAGENSGLTGPAPRVILAGAFHPLHGGHRRMAEIAQEVCGLPTVVELSILNVDKPALDYLEIERRLGQFPPEQAVWLTRAATFDDKSRLFPGTTFVVGVDTLRRIADPRYYGNDRAVMVQSLQRIVARDCRFLVFGRALGSSFIRLSDLDLPDVLRRACLEIPPEKFRDDVSSTALRKEGNW
jgi:nicotinamide mononucleotide (NMN) deamidase PncC